MLKLLHFWLAALLMSAALGQYNKEWSYTLNRLSAITHCS